MVVELQNKVNPWTSKSNSATLPTIFVCISLILSSLSLIAVTNMMIYKQDETTQNPEPPAEPNPEPNSELNYGWIMGIISNVSTSHERIKGATIRAKDYYAPTDVKGYYKIEVPAPETYNLTASARGYYNQTATDIFVDIQATVIVNFYLTLMPPPRSEQLTEKRDLAVASISSSSEAYLGQIVNVEVYLLNLGDYEENFDLAVTYNASFIETRPVFLASKDSKIETFRWNTASISPATYILTAKAILPADEVPANSIASTSIVIKSSVAWIEGYVTDRETSLPIFGSTVSADGYTATTDFFGYYSIEVPSPATYDVVASADGYYNESKVGILVDTLATVNLTFSSTPIPRPTENIHDIAITGLSAPAEAYVGDVITINVSAKNRGDYEETFNIKVTYGTTIIHREILTLNTEDSTVLSVNWNTSNIAPNDYALTAEVILDTDENPVNNQASIKIAINLEQPKGTFTWIGQHVNLTLAEWAYNLSFQNVVVRYDPDQNKSMTNLARYDIRFWRWAPYYLFENATTVKDVVDILQSEISASSSKRIYVDDVDTIYMLYGASALSNFLKAVNNVQHNNIILCFYMSNQTPYQGLYQFIRQYDWSNFHIDFYSPPNVNHSTLIPLLNSRTLGTYLWLWPYGGLGSIWKNVSLNDVVSRYNDAIDHKIQRFITWIGYEAETREVGMNEASLYNHAYWWNKVVRYNRNFLEGKSIPRDRGVILWFDDGLQNTYEVAKPILERYRYVGVISTITWMVRNYKSERYIWNDDQLRDKPILILPELLTMQNEGWEIVSHSQSHPNLDALQKYYAKWEIKGSKEWIESNLGPMKNPCFVYPYSGVYWESIVDEHYAYQRHGEEGQEPKMIWNPNDEYYGTHIPIVGIHLSKETIDYWLNETNQKGGIAIFVIHGIYENPEPESLENTPENLEYLLTKIEELELPILTLTQAIDLYQVESKTPRTLSIGASTISDGRIEEITFKSETVGFYGLHRLLNLCLNVILPVFGVLNHFPPLQSKPRKVAKATKGTAI